MSELTYADLSTGREIFLPLTSERARIEGTTGNGHVRLLLLTGGEKGREITLPPSEVLTFWTAVPALVASPPSYAPDGSCGYHLTAGRVSGWVKVGNDGRTVYATLDRAPWLSVGSVESAAELTPTWVTDHADAILARFHR